MSELRKPTNEELKAYYESTKEHIDRVQEVVSDFSNALLEQASKHDNSKYSDEEANVYAVVTPQLRTLEYGSEEYIKKGKLLGEAWKHHVANNSHHVGYYENGINDMDLFDVIEMVCDWKAASERSSNGNFQEGLEYNINRYEVDEQLAGILRNTAKRMGLFK